MRQWVCCHLLFCLALACPATAAAEAPVQVAFGKNIQRLQDFVDRRYGRGRIDVTRDYIGARAGDIDPWFWVGDRVGAVRIRLLRREPENDAVGWYLENGARPSFPEGGGVLFPGRTHPRRDANFVVPGMRTRFGFFVMSGTGDGAGEGGHVGDDCGSGRVARRAHYTNRQLNGPGPDGWGAAHAPYDGDVQALIFDLSRHVGRDAWLVCFEDRDSGGGLADDDDEDDDGDDSRARVVSGDDDRDCQRRGVSSDNDFDDVILEVKADGATHARVVTFGSLKLIYR